MLARRSKRESQKIGDKMKSPNYKGKLAFASTITKLCEDAGVDVYGLSVRPTGPITNNTLDKKEKFEDDDEFSDIFEEEDFDLDESL